jgi:hypothetical protein
MCQPKRTTELINYRDNPVLSKNVQRGRFHGLGATLHNISSERDPLRSMEHWPAARLGRRSVAWNAITHRFARIRRPSVRLSGKCDNVLPPPRANLRTSSPPYDRSGSHPAHYASPFTIAVMGPSISTAPLQSARRMSAWPLHFGSLSTYIGSFSPSSGWARR